MVPEGKGGRRRHSELSTTPHRRGAEFLMFKGISCRVDAQWRTGRFPCEDANRHLSFGWMMKPARRSSAGCAARRPRWGWPNGPGPCSCWPMERHSRPSVGKWAWANVTFASGPNASCGTEPPDVYSYGKQCADFPRQSTLDQFFSESQFESYRALGIYVVREIIRAASTRSGERTNDGGQPGDGPPSIEQLILDAAAHIATSP